MNNDFCIFIISHGRPDGIETIKTLKLAGSQLPYFIVIDNEDNKAIRYYEKYGDVVKQFNKKYYASLVDNFDNSGNYRTTTHARNACFDLAKKLGFKYFLVLDDDYTSFKFRINGKLLHPESCPNLTAGIDEIFLSVLKYFINGSFLSVCLSQGGDWFGGETNFNKKPKRKAMNSFFCSTDRRFNFISRLNEDVNTYMYLGHTGNVFLTIPFIQLDQKPTQLSSGGMSEAYINSGTYVKSFYTVMCRPDCTMINKMGRTEKRFHHLIDWASAVPCIIDEKYKKGKYRIKQEYPDAIEYSERGFLENIVTIKETEALPEEIEEIEEIKEPYIGEYIVSYSYDIYEKDNCPFNPRFTGTKDQCELFIKEWQMQKTLF